MKKNRVLELLSQKLATKESRQALVNHTFYNSEDFPIFKEHMELLAKK